jgi:rod shape-determining protein MreC
VLTSGGDQVYPRGLPVGTVESIAPDPDHQPYTAIRIKSAVDLDRVEEVLVITGTEGNLPTLTQQDLQAAEAEHAADLSAEKLPGIHDDEPPATPADGGAAAAGPSTDGTPPVLAVPHPLPTQHPDRYSPGSTPSASELTPGQSIANPSAAPAVAPSADQKPQDTGPSSSQPPKSQQPAGNKTTAAPKSQPPAKQPQ